MGFLDKVEKMVDIGNKMADLGGKINSSNLLSGINLSDVNASNLGSIQSSIESVINNKVNEIVGEVTSSIDTSQIENLANNISISDFDLPSIPGLEGITFS